METNNYLQKHLEFKVILHLTVYLSGSS